MGEHESAADAAAHAADGCVVMGRLSRPTASGNTVSGRGAARRRLGVGVRIVAFDHEFPSHIELRFTATDAGGFTDVETLRLDPRTVTLSFDSVPSGLQPTVGATSSTTPFVREVIEGSRNSISAPTP